MDYAKIENGEITEIGPEPSSWVWADGSTYTSSDAEPTPPDLLKKAGYLPVEDVYEQADPNADAMQYGEPVLTIQKTKVVRRYGLQGIPAPEPDPQAERITALEQRIAAVEMVSNHYKPMIDAWSEMPVVSEIDGRALYGMVVTLKKRIAELEAERS